MTCPDCILCIWLCTQHAGIHRSIGFPKLTVPGSIALIATTSESIMGIWLKYQAASHPSAKSVVLLACI
jgi:hypothetical protein